MNNKYRGQFLPQHTQKCYCNCGCLCLTPEHPPNQTHKFVKIRNESGQLKPRAERIPGTLPNSRSHTSHSAHSLGGYSYESRTSSSGQSRSSELTLTDRRQRYEAAKEYLRNSTLDETSAAPHSNANGTFEESIDEEAIYTLNTLNEFRLNNAKDCFAVISQYSLNERLRRLKKPPHICEFRYRLSSRGLLEPVNQNEAGEAFCADCKNVLPCEAPSGTVPILTRSSQHNFVLEVPKEEQALRRRMPVMPANSLALRYQRRY